MTKCCSVSVARSNTFLHIPGYDSHGKLGPGWIGSYAITQKISPLAYKLDFPAYFSFHPAFHINRLKRWHESARVQRPSVRRPPPVNRAQNICQVHRLLKMRCVKRGRHQIREFLVHWKGYPLSDAMWECKNDLHCPKLLQEFLSHH